MNYRLETIKREQKKFDWLPLDLARSTEGRKKAE